MKMNRLVLFAGVGLIAAALHFIPMRAVAADLTEDFAVSLPRLAPGETVVVPLPDGSIQRGEVRHVRREEGGWTRLGGTLATGGSFSFSTHDGAIAGMVQLPREGRAWQIRPQPNGASAFFERRLGEVVCVGMPRREGFAERVGEADTNVVPIFDSRPGAAAVLYLDFDGATVTDPLWDGGRTIVAPRARLSNKAIKKVWAHVAGDYSAFNINISTDPSRYANAAIGSRMRAIITRNDAAAPRAGGVAYIGSFAHDPQDGFSADIPCWVFEDSSVDACAEALSHELGHTLGLNHDGRELPRGHEEYYAGHGSGATGWVPIMGVAYYRRLSQWSKGEYRNANNQEDDVAIVAGGANGFGFVPDEAGGTLGTAADLTVAGLIVNQSGVIRKDTDVDVFKFTTSGGKLAVRVKPDDGEANVDLLVDLLDSGGATVKSNNPKGGLSAAIERPLAAGTYYLRVSGTGKGDPLRSGYSSYGSIGSYRVVGKIAGLSAAPARVGVE